MNRVFDLNEVSQRSTTDLFGDLHALVDTTTSSSDYITYQKLNAPINKNIIMELFNDHYLNQTLYSNSSDMYYNNNFSHDRYFKY